LKVELDKMIEIWDANVGMFEVIFLTLMISCTNADNELPDFSTSLQYAIVCSGSTATSPAAYRKCFVILSTFEQLDPE